MKIHHIRNATFIIESKEIYILIDPMLSGKGELPPFAYIRHKARKNPLVELPVNTNPILNKVTHCLITHSQKLGIEALTHTDHFDQKGKKFLTQNSVPVVCPSKDVSYLKKHNLKVDLAINNWKTESWLSGKITAIPAKHGHSWMHNFMANGVGYHIELPNEPSIYISGDTVYTSNVGKVLTEYKPDIAVVAAGSASLDFGGYILMSPEEIITFIRNAPGKVVANHLEALNHCPTTRNELKKKLKNEGLLSKVFIPENGETLTIAEETT
jgi:L-ascorbate metabolism protein UlaG (beta-lactamase superfamily)